MMSTDENFLQSSNLQLSKLLPTHYALPKMNKSPNNKMHKHHRLPTKQLTLLPTLPSSSPPSSAKRSSYHQRSTTNTTAQNRQAHYRDDEEDNNVRQQKLISQYSNSNTSSLSSSSCASASSATASSGASTTSLLRYSNNLTITMQGPPGPGPPLFQQQQQQQQSHSTSEPFIIKTLNVHEQIGSGGPFMLWKIYRAFTKKDAREVSVWIHDKATCERLYKKRAGDVYEILKRGVRELDRLSANSKTLLPLSVVEETIDALLFVTEPIIGSLANFLGDRVGMPATIDDCIPDEQRLVDLDLRYGLFQVVEALNALHNTEHILHGNITPRSIFLTRNAQWKLGSFEFASKRISVDGKYPILKRPPSKHAEALIPDLDYTAPELVLNVGDQHCTAAADMFSLGMTICAFYNHGQSLIDAQQQIQQNERAYKTELNKLLAERIGHFLVQVPVSLQQALEALLKVEPHERPTAHQLLLLRCFQDEELRILRQLERENYALLSTKDRAKFLVHTLSRNMHLLPRKLWFSNVLPILQADLQRPELASFAVEPLAYMLGKVDYNTYRTTFQPWLEPMYRAARTSLDNSLVVLRMAPKTFSLIEDDDIRSSLSVLIVESLEHPEFRVRLAALEASPALLGSSGTAQHNNSVLQHHSPAGFSSQHHPHHRSLNGGIDDSLNAAKLLQLVERTLQYQSSTAAPNQFNFPANAATNDPYQQHLLYQPPPAPQLSPLITPAPSGIGGAAYDEEQIKLIKAFLQLVPRFIERMSEAECTTQLIPLLMRTINGNNNASSTAGKRGDALCGPLVQCVEKLVHEREHLLTPKLLAEQLIPALYPWLTCDALQRPAFIKLAILLDAMNDRVLQFKKEYFGIDDDELPGGSISGVQTSVSPAGGSPRSTTTQSPSTSSTATTLSSGISGGGLSMYQQHQQYSSQLPAERKYSVPERLAHQMSQGSTCSPPPAIRVAVAAAGMSQHRYTVTPASASAGTPPTQPQWSPVSRKFIQRLTNGNSSSTSSTPQLIVSHAGSSPSVSPSSQAQRRRMSKSALYSPPRRFSKQDSAPFLNAANLLAVAGIQKSQKNYSAPGTPQRRESILETGAKNALNLLGVSSGSSSANRRHSITRLGLGMDSSLSQRRHSAVNIQSITSGVGPALLTFTK